MELYKLKGVQEIIQLADHLVQYRDYKADQEKERIAKMAPQEKRAHDMAVQSKRNTRPLRIKKRANVPEVSAPTVAFASPATMRKNTARGPEAKPG